MEQLVDAELPRGAIFGVIGEARELVARLKGRAHVIGPHEELKFPADRLALLEHALAFRGRVERGLAARELDRFRRAGGTAVVVCHDEDFLAAASDEIWWVDGGTLRGRGEPRMVLDAYRAECARVLRDMGDGASPAIEPAMRRGDGRAVIGGIQLVGELGQPTVVWRSGELVEVIVTVKFRERVEDPVVGMLIRTRVGLNVYGTNTELEKLVFGPCAPGQTVEIAFAFRCELCPGEYTLTVASHDPDGVWHEWLEDAVAFSVTDSRYTAGVANLRATVTVK